MQEINLSEEKKYRSNSTKVNLQVLNFEEDKIYFAYMPSFDLTGYGETEEEAKESLTIVLDEFLRYTLNKKTLFIEMQRLGWNIKDKKKPLRAPQISDLINSNEQLKKIVNTKQYTASNYQTNIPALNA
jgi:predicted RNase H-like HicB family nuclease